jgi:hypothetical protein
MAPHRGNFKHEISSLKLIAKPLAERPAHVFIEDEPFKLQRGRAGRK